MLKFVRLYAVTKCMPSREKNTAHTAKDCNMVEECIRVSEETWILPHPNWWEQELEFNGETQDGRGFSLPLD